MGIVRSRAGTRTEDAVSVRQHHRPATRSVTSRIASWAAATPNKVAVTDETRVLSYGELERDSNRLAARLREAGAGPERCVGLLVERSTDFVVGALAALKSGAAYVPLDPSTPKDRISSILSDAGAVALVTSSSFAMDDSKSAWAAIAIDHPNPASGAFARVEPDPEMLAYVIYTSGSTGRPKGVEITHAGVCNLIDWHQSAFSVSAADRASQVAGLGFDAAAWEIWPYLTAGASLHIADDATRRSPEMLRDWLVAQKITIGFVPTVMAEQLFRIDWPADTALRTLLTGGDRLGHRPRAGLPFSVVNNYGPTECTVVATSGVVAPEGNGTAPPSIGRVIANATALVLDDALRPVPVGEPGELCMSGALVARGYRNLPELSARRFVAYITASGESLRLYRTGDRVRLLENGEFEFLGRFDDQVKIRGYRIELGEIEAALNQYPTIAAAAASVVEDATGAPTLAAYVVPAGEARLTESELRDHLATKLPAYMIPAFFVAIPSLPVMVNGKLDKTALPDPEKENLLPKSAANGKLSGLEEQIADFVALLMGRPSVGADENLFMIGGHSMFGVQLVARIRETFGVKMPLRHVFSAPTVRELSKEVARLMRADGRECTT
ncbi:MAG TPA: non-ribosomal peptide synthetase [Candidatus Cybelea sp.]|jgi:amino acid adenylation domain-containing protein|nr:non-ribosomal peptide synthetase [Candidatus Cybelea sp.]